MTIKPNSAILARILFVEDQPDTVSGSKRLLMRYGFEVDSAHTLEEAYDKLRDKGYDYLFLDLMLPSTTQGQLLELGGLELLRDIQGGALGERNRDIKIVIVTGQNKSFCLGEVPDPKNCLMLTSKLEQHRALDAIRRDQQTRAGT